MTRWACSIFILFASGCDVRVTEVEEPEWLDVCSSDSDCGDLSCLCGVCSLLCEDTADCASGRCVVVGSAKQLGGDTCALADTDKVCAPECLGDACSSTTTKVRPSGTRASEAEPVPACAIPARTTGLPLVFFHTEIARYEGPGTVHQRTESNTIVLVLNDITGGLLELQFNAPKPDALALGRRVEVDLRSSGSGSAKRSLLVLRDENDRLLLVTASGDDRLYQEGVFSDRNELGFSLELTMSCQSAALDGCFEDQVQAEYAGTLQADDEISTDGSSPALLHIDGAAYDVSFWSSSVDGGKRRSDCTPDITPGRYLNLALVRR